MTSTATSRRLHTTLGQRGKPCYRAPELVRNADTGGLFNRKVDIWALGCILFEMCIGRKAFKHDFETDDFAFRRLELSIDFPEWFDTDTKTTYEHIIRQMLDSDYQKRPSVDGLCVTFINILKMKRLKSEEEPLLTSGDRFFIESRNMLGTTVPSDEGFHGLRWELSLPGKWSTEWDTEKWTHLEKARERLLSRNHPNTVWIRFCAAWTLVSMRNAAAIDAFRDLIKVLEQKSIGHLSLLSAYYGLSWALAEDGKLGESAREFQKLIEVAILHEEGRENVSINRLLLYAKSSLARNHLLWQPHERTAEYLEQIVVEQTKLIGPEHSETLETQTLRGIARLLLHDSAATDQGLEILSNACGSPTILLTSERPAIFTLCGLCWLFYRTDRISEALRIFYKTVELQKRHLDKQFPLTATSLEALSSKMPTGPILWTASGNDKSLNNKGTSYGRVGTLKCSNCRRRKIRVDTPLHQD